MYEQIQATVVAGKNQGIKTWFPTINLPVTKTDVSSGTYRVTIIIENKKYRGLWPFFAERNLFEIHILDFSGNLYDQQVTIIPLYKIRENSRFATTTQLIAQIKEDIEWTKNHVHKVITFGTFDYLHPGHISYLTQASYYGDQLITIVARDKTVKDLKGFLPDHTEHERATCLRKLNLADHVELGDPVDHYTCLRHHQPQVICLGYDQHSFDDKLKSRCKQHLPETTIIRLQPFEPEKRKSSLIKGK